MMSSPRPPPPPSAEGEELLIEQAASAYREPRPDGSFAGSPAWHDLGPEGREQAFDRASWLRAVEAAFDPEGLSASGRLVLERIRKPRP